MLSFIILFVYCLLKRSGGKAEVWKFRNPWATLLFSQPSLSKLWTFSALGPLLTRLDLSHCPPARPSTTPLDRITVAYLEFPLTKLPSQEPGAEA